MSLQCLSQPGTATSSSRDVFFSVAQPSCSYSVGSGMQIPVVLLFLGLLTVPSRSQNSATGQNSATTDGANAGEVEEEDPFYKSPVNKLAAAVSNFGYDLYRQQSSRTATANVLLSPFSLATALSGLSLGAGERTEDVISRALFYDLLNKAEVHNTYKDLLASVIGPEKSPEKRLPYHLGEKTEGEVCFSQPTREVLQNASEGIKWQCPIRPSRNQQLGTAADKGEDPAVYERHAHRCQHSPCWGCLLQGDLGNQV
uniref:Serpin domain-containing protein n=1 Tax=Anas platyrhynchos TaxID=8839 RepID=A0A8B9R4G3_ANAPL